MSELSDIFDSLEQSPLANHAKYIGYLCVTWSRLEGTVDALLSVLMNLDDINASAAVIYNMDFRDKLKAARALGYLNKPTDDWYAELEKLINEIDNDLRPERNRMVHDICIDSGDEIFRIANHAKVVREQARKLKLSYGHGKPTPLSDVMTLVVKVLAVCGHILKLLDEHPNTSRSLSDKP